MLHSIDHGVFVRLLDLVCEFVLSSSQAIQHDFESRYALLSGCSRVQYINVSSARWGDLTPYEGFKIFSGGVLQLRMVRGFQHRSMAVSLPFVLHKLFPESNAPQAAAVAYITWRAALDAVIFQDSMDFADADVLGLSGLDTVERLGCELQQRMNELSRLVKEDDDDITCECMFCALHLIIECACRHHKIP